MKFLLFAAIERILQGRMNCVSSPTDNCAYCQHQKRKEKKHRKSQRIKSLKKDRFWRNKLSENPGHTFSDTPTRANSCAWSPLLSKIMLSNSISRDGVGHKTVQTTDNENAMINALQIRPKITLRLHRRSSNIWLLEQNSNRQVNLAINQVDIVAQFDGLILS